ncbi:MAG: hypothetical protein QOG59_2282, partial [Solirubrobacteraceae bacterium]|nr:hypothetical protein [Solirubrobacteraceae bacterium]
APPSAWTRALDILLHNSLTAANVAADGTLELRFDDGYLLDVPPSPQWEAASRQWLAAPRCSSTHSTRHATSSSRLTSAPPNSARVAQRCTARGDAMRSLLPREERLLESGQEVGGSAGVKQRVAVAQRYEHPPGEGDDTERRAEWHASRR